MLKKLLGFVVVIVVAAAGWWLLKDELSGSDEVPRPLAQGERSAREPVRPRGPAPSPAEPEVARPVAGSTREAAVAPPSVVLPSLAESDPFVRTRLAAFSIPDAWIARDGLVRLLATVTDNSTRGEVPARQVAYLKPTGAFRVIESDGRIYPHPENARRFDPYLSRLEAIDPAALAEFLTLIGPLLEGAFSELGNSAGSRSVLVQGIDAVLAMSVEAGTPELVRPKVLYRYADPELEALSPFEKQLLRLGPENLERLQRVLAALRGELMKRPA